MSEIPIATRSRPLCPVCNSEGKLCYEGMTDTLFHSGGTWNVKKCSHARCGTLWLDPTPEETELHKLYKHYSTHEDGFISPPPRHLLLGKVRAAYLHSKYGYGNTSSPLGLLAYLHPAWRDTQEANIFYLPYIQNGKLLDVGCGSGSAMQQLEKMGWDTEGIDFDEKAIENAKQKGLTVSVGDIFSKNYADESFDAILMNHVIEHLPHPLSALQECKRILKQNGIVVALTPNTNSRGHARFGKYWRGLEIPQHLQLFSVSSLHQLARQAGFKDVQSFSSTQGILSIYDASQARAAIGSFDVHYSPSLLGKLTYHMRWFLFGIRRLLKADKDEVAVIICKK